MAQARKNKINNHLLKQVLTVESAESTLVNYRRMSVSNPNNKVLIDLPAESNSMTADRMSISNPNNNNVVDLSSEPTWDSPVDDFANPPPLMRDDSSDDENTEDDDFALAIKESLYEQSMSALANSGGMVISSISAQRRMDFEQQKPDESAGLDLRTAIQNSLGTLREAEEQAKRFSSLQAWLTAEHQCRIIETAAYGDCLFCALALQLYNDAERHRETRALCCDFISNNRYRFPLIEDIDSYLQQMRRVQTYGDSDCIEAFYRQTGCPVFVFQIEKNIPRVWLAAGKAAEAKLKHVASFRLCFDAASKHYCSVVPIIPPGPEFQHILPSQRFNDEFAPDEDFVAQPATTDRFNSPAHYRLGSKKWQGEIGIQQQIVVAQMPSWGNACMINLYAFLLMEAAEDHAVVFLSTDYWNHQQSQCPLSIASAIEQINLKGFSFDLSTIKKIVFPVPLVSHFQTITVDIEARQVLIRDSLSRNADYQGSFDPDKLRQLHYACIRKAIRRQCL